MYFDSQRSFRATKSPLRSGHHHSKGGSFFHRRLSSKSPSRGPALSTTDIQLDESQSTVSDPSSHDLSLGTDPVSHKVTECLPSCTKLFLPRSSSNPYQADPSSSSYSNPDPVSAPGRDRGRTGLGQSLSVDDDIYPLTLAPPETVLASRKGSASSEGSTGGRKSPKERLVRKMIQVFK